MSTYTSAIRKIYEIQDPSLDLCFVSVQAKELGYELFMFNGSIYFIGEDSDCYDDTGLTLDDITVSS